MGFGDFLKAAVPVAASMIPGIGPVAGAVAGGLMGYAGADDQKAVALNNAPWAGIQPYMIGEGAIPSYITSPPSVSNHWTNWANKLASGAENSWMTLPPPMFAPTQQPQYSPAIGATPGITPGPTSTASEVNQAIANIYGLEPDVITDPYYQWINQTAYNNSFPDLIPGPTGIYYDPQSYQKIDARKMNILNSPYADILGGN